MKWARMVLFGAAVLSGAAGLARASASHDVVVVPINGTVGEVIAFSGTLTATQVKTIETYLVNKWG